MMKKPTRLSRRQRLSELVAFTKICFAMLDEPDLKEIANKTGLSVSTLRRLANHTFTLAVHFGTIQALGLAAGLRLTQTERSSSVQLV